MAENNFEFSKEPCLRQLQDLMRHFVAERNWDQFHTPRNLMMAMVGEVGELAEIFQWKGEVEEGLPGFSEAEKEHVGQEMSDVLLYLLRMADKCHIDLPAAALKKIRQNEKKYPAKAVFGKSDKYTAYARNHGDKTGEESKDQHNIDGHSS